MIIVALLQTVNEIIIIMIKLKDAELVGEKSSLCCQSHLEVFPYSALICGYNHSKQLHICSTLFTQSCEMRQGRGDREQASLQRSMHPELS